MGLVPGYNFVRAGAPREFLESFRREYGDAVPEKLSVLEFLRLVQHKRRPPHRCLRVHGFENLWKLCEDDPALALRIKQLLALEANWVRGAVSYVYFVFPSEVTFVDGKTFQLCLPSGEHADLDVIFGHPKQEDRDHYHRPFAMS